MAKQTKVGKNNTKDSNAARVPVRTKPALSEEEWRLSVMEVYDEDPDVTGGVEPEPVRISADYFRPRRWTAQDFKRLSEHLRRSKRVLTAKEKLTQAEGKLQAKLDEFFLRVAEHIPAAKDAPTEELVPVDEEAKPEADLGDDSAESDDFRIDDFGGDDFEDLYDEDDEDDDLEDTSDSELEATAPQPRKKPKMFVMRLPVGFGKTEATVRSTIRFLAARRAEQLSKPRHGDQEKQQGKGYFPLVFSAPSYDLLKEIEERLHREAVKQDLMPDDLQISWFKGKSAAGCLRQDDLKASTQMGLPSNKLCMPMVGVFCKHFKECPVIDRLHVLNSDPRGPKVRDTMDFFQDRPSVPTDDLVLTPHAMLTQTTLPYTVKNAQGLIVDESVVSMMLENVTFPLSILTKNADLLEAPFPLSADGKKGRESAMLYLHAVIGRALQTGHQPAVAVFDTLLAHARGALGSDPNEDGDSNEEEDVAENGSAVDEADVLAKAFKTSESLFRDFKRLNWEKRRNSAAQEVGDDSQSKAYGHLADMWNILSQQIYTLHRLHADRLYAGQVSGTDAEGAEGNGQAAQPVRLSAMDKRISVFGSNNEAPNTVSLAWRKRFAVPDCPVMILDASADPIIYRILFGRSHDIDFLEIKEEDIGLRQRNVLVTGGSFSKSSLTTGNDATKKMAQVKTAIRKVAQKHEGKILVVTLKSLRERFEREFEHESAKIDFMHYGALRGIDSAKNHDAAVLVSAFELPLDVLERKSHALSYNQRPIEVAEDEAAKDAGPMKFLKTTHRSLRTRGTRRSSGGVLVQKTYVHRDFYAALLQKQTREEEIVQAYGRLRSLRKIDRKFDDWQTAYIMSSACPPNLIIDKAIHIDDLSETSKLVAAAKLCHNAVSSLSLVHFGISKSRSGDVEKSRKAAAKLIGEHGLKQGAGEDEYEERSGWAECQVATLGERGKPLSVWVYLDEIVDPYDNEDQIIDLAIRHVAELRNETDLTRFAVRNVRITQGEYADFDDVDDFMGSELIYNTDEMEDSFLFSAQPKDPDLWSEEQPELTLQA